MRRQNRLENRARFFCGTALNARCLRSGTARDDRRNQEFSWCLLRNRYCLAGLQLVEGLLACAYSEPWASRSS